MLSPPIKTYKPNPFASGSLGLFGILILHTLLTEAVKDTNIQLALALILLACSVVIAWLLSLRLSIHEEGIYYRSLFGSQEMQWDQIDRFYYGAIKETSFFIPLGTYYSFKLVDNLGRKLSFGNRFSRQGELAKELLQRTYRPLLDRFTNKFENYVELDFDAIRLARGRGLRIKKWFHWKEIPLDQVADYKIEKGNFYIWPVGKKYVVGIRVYKIANAFVLLGILDAVIGSDG